MNNELGFQLVADKKRHFYPTFFVCFFCWNMKVMTISIGKKTAHVWNVLRKKEARAFFSVSFPQK